VRWAAGSWSIAASRRAAFSRELVFDEAAARQRAARIHESNLGFRGPPSLVVATPDRATPDETLTMNALTKTLAPLATLFATTVAIAQVGGAIAGAGQPVLAAIRPTLQNALPLPIVQVVGNPNFRIHAAVVHPQVPVGSPIFLLLGLPSAAPIPLPAGLLSPLYGAPGTLAMSEILAVVPATVAGTMGTPPVSLPIPQGLGPLGHFLTAQILVVAPGGFALTGATGIGM